MDKKFGKNNFYFRGMQRAKVIEEVSLWLPGRVAVAGSYWNALLHESCGQSFVPPGEWVEVIDRQGC